MRVWEIKYDLRSEMKTKSKTIFESIILFKSWNWLLTHPKKYNRLDHQVSCRHTYVLIMLIDPKIVGLSSNIKTSHNDDQIYISQFSHMKISQSQFGLRSWRTEVEK